MEKFPDSVEFQSWKVNFKTEVCSKTADPHLVKTTPHMTRFRDGRVFNNLASDEIDDHRTQSDHKCTIGLQYPKGKELCTWKCVCVVKPPIPKTICDRSGKPDNTQGVFIVKGETSRSQEIDVKSFNEELCSSDRSGQHHARRDRCSNMSV